MKNKKQITRRSKAIGVIQEIAKVASTGTLDHNDLQFDLYNLIHPLYWQSNFDALLGERVERWQNTLELNVDVSQAVHFFRQNMLRYVSHIPCVAMTMFKVMCKGWITSSHFGDEMRTCPLCAQERNDSFHMLHFKK